MKRREFMKTTTKIAGAVGVSGGTLLTSCSSKSSELIVSAIIPLPIQVVIDDVGWWSGKDGSEYQEPYRTGINRNHVLADYQAIVDLGKALGIRPQAATVLGEWDKQNILQKVPHSTWMGNDWDNSKWVGAWLEAAADIINNNKDHFEIAMHGLGHEWWTDGKFSRAEWADTEGVMRPKEDVERHLDAYAEILIQNKLGELPTSFVPTAFRHGFGLTPGNEQSIAELFASRGFVYINTPFEIMLNKEKAQYDIFGVDSGIITVDRGADLLDWDVIGGNPEGVIAGSTCGMHWPNMLHEDPERNSEIVDRWVKFLAPYNDKQETLLAKSSLTFQQQLVHHKLTKVEIADSAIKLDFSDTNKIDTIILNEELTVKVSSHAELKFSSDTMDIVSVSSTKKNEEILHILSLRKTGMSNEVISCFQQ